MQALGDGGSGDLPCSTPAELWGCRSAPASVQSTGTVLGTGMVGMGKQHHHGCFLGRLTAEKEQNPGLAQPSGTEGLLKQGCPN